MRVGDKWSTGSRVLRRWIEIPEKINGYAVQGARVKLDLRFDFNWNNKGPVTIAVFSNGSLVSRGDDDMQQPIPLTEKRAARAEISDRRANRCSGGRDAVSSRSVDH